MTPLDEKILSHLREAIQRQDSLTYDELEALTGAHRMSVCKSLRRLKESGVLTVRRVGARNVYKVNEW